MEEIKKEAITEEMHPEKDWFQEARNVDTEEKLLQFVHHILEEYEHDYGTAVHAVSACALAAAWLGCHKQGITGFQAGFVMWDFVVQWNHSDNKCGMKFLDYDKMLYPQYEHVFDKTIHIDNFKLMQEEAKKILESSEKDHVALAPEVKSHLQTIALGTPPFGYTIRDND